MNVIEFESFGKQLRAVSDEEQGKTAISRLQAFTLEEQKAVTYNQVADTYLAIMEFAKEHNLELIGSETAALAFLMNTCASEISGFAAA